jgi:enoyl-CoA hydratase
MSDDAVVLEWPHAGVAVVSLNRPDRLNALTPEVVASFVATLTEASAAPGCRVVIVTGRGRGFCAGMDIAAGVERERTTSRGSGVRLEAQELFASMPRTIRSLPQPVIAAVNGAAAGAGMAITLAADVRLAAASASFHVAAVKIGLSAGECGISYHLPRHIGTSRAFELMLTGRPIDAAEAERIGLVSTVVPDGEVLDAALELAAAIVSNSPFAVRMTKALMWANLDNDFHNAIELENRTQILAVMTEDSKEAMRAFTEKRPPVFTGK